MPSGTVADGAGNALLDTNGQPIQLSSTDTQITIAGDGTVSSENGQLGKIGVVQATDPLQLTAEGNTQFRFLSPTVAGRVARAGAGRGRGLQRPARDGDRRG